MECMQIMTPRARRRFTRIRRQAVRVLLPTTRRAAERPRSDTMRIRSLRADSEASGEACSVEGEMGKARVFVSLLAQDQEFQRLQAADATETAAHHGLDVEIAFAENNGVVQIQQLFKAIHAPAEERPRAIVVETVTGEGLERVARNAVRAGV